MENNSETLVQEETTVVSETETTEAVQEKTEQVKKPKKEKKQKKKKSVGRIIGRILSYIAVFIFGAVVALGGLVGVILSINVGGVLESVVPEYEQYISRELADNTLLDMITAIAEGEYNNLGDLKTISPYIETLAGDIALSVSDLGLEIDKDELLNTNFDVLDDYIMNDVLYNAKLGTLLTVTPSSDAIMRYIAYGTESVDYDVVAGEIVMREGHFARTINDLINNSSALIGNLTIGSVITIPANAPQILHSLKVTKVSELSDFIENLSLRDVITIDSSSAQLLQALADEKVTELGPVINNLTLGDVVDAGAGAAQILQSMNDVKITDLSDAVNDLTLGDIMVINNSSPSILRDNKNTKIKNLENIFDNLKVKDVVNINSSSAPLLKKLQNEYVADLGDVISVLKLGDVVEITENAHPVLKELQNVSINGLSDKLDDAIGHLTVGDIIPIDESSAPFLKFLKDHTLDRLDEDFSTELTLDNILGDAAFDTSTGENHAVLEAVRYCKLDELEDTLMNVTINDLYKDEIYPNGDKTQAPLGVWHYLLYNNGGYEEVKLKNFPDLCSHVAENIAAATLFDLCEHGMLNSGDNTATMAVLNKKLPGDSKKIGEYTIDQLLAKLSAIAH